MRFGKALWREEMELESHSALTYEGKTNTPVLHLAVPRKKASSRSKGSSEMTFSMEQGHLLTKGWELEEFVEARSVYVEDINDFEKLLHQKAQHPMGVGGHLWLKNGGSPATQDSAWLYGVGIIYKKDGWMSHGGDILLREDHRGPYLRRLQDAGQALPTWALEHIGGSTGVGAGSSSSRGGSRRSSVSSDVSGSVSAAAGAGLPPSSRRSSVSSDVSGSVSAAAGADLPPSSRRSSVSSYIGGYISNSSSISVPFTPTAATTATAGAFTFGTSSSSSAESDVGFDLGAESSFSLPVPGRALDLSVSSSSSNSSNGPAGAGAISHSSFKGALTSSVGAAGYGGSAAVVGRPLLPRPPQPSVSAISSSYGGSTGVPSSIPPPASAPSSAELSGSSNSGAKRVRDSPPRQGVSGSGGGGGTGQAGIAFKRHAPSHSSNSAEASAAAVGGAGGSSSGPLCLPPPPFPGSAPAGGMNLSAPTPRGRSNSSKAHEAAAPGQKSERPHSGGPTRAENKRNDGRTTLGKLAKQGVVFGNMSSFCAPQAAQVRSGSSYSGASQAPLSSSSAPLAASSSASTGVSATFGGLGLGRGGAAGAGAVPSAEPEAMELLDDMEEFAGDWQCEACTLINGPAAGSCGVCGTER